MNETRITFYLAPDDDGYPPVRYERLWAQPLPDGNFKIDSIPFYVYGISPEDVVSAQQNEDGELHFQGLIKASGISTFRLYVADDNMQSAVRAHVEQLGCKSEAYKEAGLIAIEVPENTDIHPVLNYLMWGRSSEEFDFEEAALRHTL